MTITQTREKPILFRPEMVAAILAGRKTQTRRMIKPQPIESHGRIQEACNTTPEGWQTAGHSGRWLCEAATGADDCEWRCPYVPGSVLWVREALEWRRNEGQYTHGIQHPDEPPDLQYAADSAPVLDVPDDIKPSRAMIPSIHMPHWACRLRLRVTEVRVQRVQEISEADTYAEGISKLKSEFPNPRAAFRQLWEFINGEGSWDSNPWVWAYTFEVVK